MFIYVDSLFRQKNYFSYMSSEVATDPSEFPYLPPQFLAHLDLNRPSLTLLGGMFLGINSLEQNSKIRI